MKRWQKETSQNPFHFFFFHVFDWAQKTTAEDDSHAQRIGKLVKLNFPICGKILQFTADTELVSVVMLRYTGQLTSIAYQWS